MDSFTTVDLSFRFDGSDLASSGFLDGFTAVLSVQNLLDEDPPLFPNSLQGVLYDTANASPVGRFVAIQFVKAW
jgi:outer membrane receptor protein involved in Fe transport